VENLLNGYRACVQSFSDLVLGEAQVRETNDLLIEGAPLQVFELQMPELKLL
jgi:hypothetical protein